MGRNYKLPDGNRIQVVGVVEDGKYSPNLTDPLPPAMFLPILQSPSTETYVIVRSSGNPQQLAAAIRTKLRDLDRGLSSFIQTWNQAMDGALFASRDRKSTRLNSSHSQISYAVFCLKKKKKKSSLIIKCTNNYL